MSIMTATLPTTEASRLINRLCKHFSHKAPAQWDADSGEVTFIMGRCQLQATPDTLQLTCRAEDAEAVQAVADIVASHLLRFAAGTLDDVAWTTTVA